MSVGVPGPRGTLDLNIPTSPRLRVRLDPNDPNVRVRPLHEALAEAGLDETSFFEGSTSVKGEKARLTKSECNNEDEGKEQGSSPRPRGFLKRLFRFF